MKPTYGRVSRYGLSAYASSLDQIGPITQNVEDSAILYDIIASHDPKDSTSSDVKLNSVSKNLNPDRKLKIAVVDNYIDEASDSIKKAYRETVKALESEGHEIIQHKWPNTKYDIATYYIVATAEATKIWLDMDGIDME